MAYLAQDCVDKPLRSFSIGFTENGGNGDELPYASDMARFLGTNHEEYILCGKEIASEFEKIVWHLDQPSIDGINTYYVSKTANKHVKVALTGLGGDELFGGYPHFNRFVRQRNRSGLIVKALRKMHENLPTQVPGRVRLALEFEVSTIEERHAMIRRVFTEQEKRRIMNQDLIMLEKGLYPISEYYKMLIGKGKDPVQEVSYVEMYGYMNRMLLRDADAMSMAHSLELRVPFLDHELVEYVYAMPAELKVGVDGTKIALKELVKGKLPDWALKREKRGFDLPMTEWLSRGALRAKAEEVLSSPEASKTLSTYGIEEAVKALRRGEFYAKPWSLVVLVSWLSMNGVVLNG
ncbi:MAG: asparagine synthase C-terminal domain-containing protein [Candidatus Methanomethylicaceae archaeon]